MRQKYVLEKSDKEKRLVIREYAELDKDLMSPLCEEAYDYKVLREAAGQGRGALLAVLRTRNLYPPTRYSEKIAETVVSLLDDGSQETAELFFDDVELLTREREALATLDEVDDEPGELDDLLDGDADELYDDKERLDKLESGVKIEDEQYSADVDDDS